MCVLFLAPTLMAASAEECSHAQEINTVCNMSVCTGRSDDRVLVDNKLGQVGFEQHETFVKWSENMELRQFLQNCVYERRRKTDVLKLVQERFSSYKWSRSNLSRRMKVFALEFVENKIPLEKIAQAIQMERLSSGNSTSRGRRISQREVVKILRERYKLSVSREAVKSVLKRLSSTTGAFVGNMVHCSEKVSKVSLNRKYCFIVSGLFTLVSLHDESK